MSGVIRPRRPAVIVGTHKGMTNKDPYDPSMRLGERLLVFAGREKFPDKSKLETCIAQDVHVNGKVSPVRLAAEARRIATEFAPRDIVCIGREVADAFGMSRSTPLFAWWPSWVLGPDRWVMIIPDPRAGITKDIQTCSQRMREVMDDLWDDNK